MTDSAMPEMLALGKQILAEQPFSRLLGAEITELAPLSPTTRSASRA